MRRLLALLGGIGFAGAWLARRRAKEQTPAEADPRAEELRRRLEESRSLAGEQEEFSAGETPVDTESADERRRRVHEHGRAAIDDMQSED